jgi:hypothetical protein
MTLLAVLLAAAVPPAARPAFAPQTERRVEREVPAACARVLAFHGFGECTVRGLAAKEKPRARLELVASGGGDGVERRYLELVDLSVTSEPAPGEPGRLVTTIRSVFPAAEQKPESLSFAANLTLWVPEDAALEVESGFGKVIVNGRGADVKVVNKLAPVEVRGVRGFVRVENPFGEILVEDVTGDALLRGKSSAITAWRVGGLVDARTNGASVVVDGAGSVFVETRLKPVDLRNVAGDAQAIAPFCNVTAREIAGSLTIESSNGTVTADGVGRDLSIQHKNGKVDARRVKGSATVIGNLTDVSLSDVAGAAEVRTASAPVKVSGVGGRLVAENSARALEIVNARGDVEASARGGQLRLRWTRLPADGAAHEVTLEGEAGGIELDVPDGASATLELTCTAGPIDCELPGMSFAQAGAARTGRLVLGEGDVKLHATCVGGAIRVRRAVPR